MAQSPPHKWGQIIGQEFLEVAVEPLLRATAEKHNLFLDVKGPRPSRGGKRIAWRDHHGNTHDLDFVLERGGTPETTGDPVAFIETAWRRYTRHSRNKAQEIQGAIMPLATAHQRQAPFIGVIAAGEWTAGAITQLQSLGFKVLYFSYSAIVEVFRFVGIDARFTETTPDAECRKKVRQWAGLNPGDRATLGRRLVTANQADVDGFMRSLEEALTRQIEVIRVLPLHGIAVEAPTVDGAMKCVRAYDERTRAARPLARYEIQVRYNNGDTISGVFGGKEDALGFLQSFRPPLSPS